MARTSVLARAEKVEPNPTHQNVLAATARMVPEQVEVLVRTADGGELALPAELVRILLASAGELARGHAVTVLASEVQLSPTETAELLGLSRPFVARLLDAGDIPSTNLPGSSHRVVRLADVLAFQQRRQRRREGRRQIADALDDAGLPC
ncbi:MULTISPECIES: helix-turn-helix domain-containing protein [unclassified Streptomyces]|uniref:helix-turn-helix domain-containing protein n=1 Tax=unclassified Streptomyces TaxID=2593676 RepID=UPI001BE51331|nr:MULTISPECIES: helix-turn-helix domain-containing protein [unclassified Streptomyces]MBT2408271.1 helix-turn-helix domain-containing protein [Streptomyces sp. ISL-21]MBT2607353.1 helix-turn-helix domain-containing protein [Streptomyces sp. ISL-87]